MNTGVRVSAVGHIGLILWLLFGGLIGTGTPPPPPAVDVSVISAEEFAALSAPRSPNAAQDTPTPEAPVETAPAVSPRPQPAPQLPDRPTADAPSDPDPTPQQPDPLTPEAEVADTAPQVPAPPASDPAAELSPDPAPRDLPRVAPTPAPEPPPDTSIAETASPSVSPDAETPEVAVEDAPPAAPEAATTEIVTEADQPGSAPTRSRRPPVRPVRQAAAAPAPTPEPQDDPDTPPATEDDNLANAVAAAVAGAIADTPSGGQASDAPVGPPLSQGEREGLRVAVQACWNVGSLSSEALATTVIVAVSMGTDGVPDASSIRMLSSSGGSDIAARQAFEAARRAVIRCGVNGYDLPEEKYAQWRDIEMTFNPESMRTR